MKKIFYIIFICIWGCTDATNENGNKEKFLSITLIDTFTNNLIPDTANYITEAEFHPMYMGAEKDSIQLNYYSGNIQYETLNWNEYKAADSLDLEIFIDTSQIIGSNTNFYSPPPPLSEIGEDINEPFARTYTRGETKSYPVFVKNLSKDTLQVGYGEYIPLIIEAKDSLDNWKRIQKPFMYFCGTGLSHYYLPPNEIILTSCKLFKGDFKTKMRLIYGFGANSMSNEFVGAINYSQFEKYKEVYY